MPDRGSRRPGRGIQVDDALFYRDLHGPGHQGLGHRSQHEPCLVSPWLASTPEGPTTAAAAAGTGQSSSASSAGIAQELSLTTMQDARRPEEESGHRA